MTITVNTLESGTHKFPSADKLRVDQDGRLWVRRGELTEAIFNIKEWLAVVSEVDSEASEPRVWQDWDSLNAARHTAERHTTVKNPDGVIWTLYTAEDAEYGMDRPEWLWSSTEATTTTLRLRVGPFTEVLDK